MLVDTGANYSILSRNLVHRLQLAESRITPLQNVKIITATGESSPCIGQINLSIAIGKLVLMQQFIIADIQNEGLLGLDFLSENESVICLDPPSLEMNGLLIPLNKRNDINRDNLRCCRIAIQETVVVPPETEVIVNGKLIDQISSDSSCGIVESSLAILEKKGILVAKALVSPAQSVVPLRIANFGFEPCTIFKNSVVANLDLVDPSCTEFVENDEKMKNSLQKCALPDYMDPVVAKCSTHLNESQVEQVKNLILDYLDIFSKGSNDIGCTNLATHEINTGTAAPVKQHPRRLPFAKREIAEAEIKKMVDQDIIEPACSPWNSNVVLVTRPGKDPWFCLDYRGLNEVTIKDSHALPRIDETLDALNGSQWFSTLDLKSGYWQVPIEEKARYKTAFSILGGGMWQFKVMPFGLTNAPATF